MRWNRAQRLRAGYLVLLGAVAVGQVAPQPAAPASPAPQSQNATPVPTHAPAFLIMIDPAHGGTDSGAALNAAFPEKDVTLVLARRLRRELLSRGIQSQLLRDADLMLPTDQRASQVNALQPYLYLVIHATSQGSGLRLYTAMLPLGEDNRGSFVDWQTAQAASLARSRLVQEQITGSIHSTGFPVRGFTAPLRPLNNVTVPAMAVEVAPTTGDISQLASSDYQQMVCAVLANGIASAMPLLTRAGRGQ